MVHVPLLTPTLAHNDGAEELHQAIARNPDTTTLVSVVKLADAGRVSPKALMSGQEFVPDHDAYDAVTLVLGV